MRGRIIWCLVLIALFLAVVWSHGVNSPPTDTTRHNDTSDLSGRTVLSYTTDSGVATTVWYKQPWGSLSSSQQDRIANTYYDGSRCPSGVSAKTLAYQAATASRTKGFSMNAEDLVAAAAVASGCVRK